MFKYLILIFLSINLFANNINIAVSANVSYAMNELIKEFNKTNPNIKINPIIGSSGKLTAQIKNGANYMLFLSANMKYPNNLYDWGLTLTKPKVYARGKLILLSTKNINNLSLNTLINKNIKKIAMANALTAPYGIATKEVLENSEIYDNVKHKLVYAESISHTLSFIIKITNIGFISKSLLYNKKFSSFKENKNYIEIDSSLHKPINQGIVLLKKAQYNTSAKLFYDFLLSEKAKSIYIKYGYEVQ